ncbi:MAG TPA: DivIVA domain-containing protein [Solirubrobacteraceae bacterium]|nr:DivIVA domain-containing protein [Solirubrobacteraceae bacterium]
MSDFERSGDRSGVTYDEPIKRRSPGMFFADIGDKLARGFNSFDRPQPDEPDWDRYEELDQPTAAVDTLPPEEPSRRRFPTSLHGYDRDAVEDYIDGLEHEIGQMAAKLSAQRSPTSAVQAEIDRVGEETSAILRVAHEQAAEITRRARVEADRCVSDAAANAVSMTEDAKRKLRQLDSETDAVWAERMRLIEDVRNVATSLFSLAEDATDRFPEDGDKDSATVSASAVQPASKPTPQAQQAQPAQAAPPAQTKAAPVPQQRGEPGAPAPATPAASAQHRPATPSPVAASQPMPAPSPVAAQNHAPRPDRPRS